MVHLHLLDLQIGSVAAVNGQLSKDRLSLLKKLLLYLETLGDGFDDNRGMPCCPRIGIESEFEAMPKFLKA